MSNPTADMPTAEQAMERLMAGNKRYVASKQTHPHQTRERCVELSAGQSAVDQVQDLPGDLVDNAVRANAKMVAEQLRSSQPVLAELVNAGELKIVAALYDLDTGGVELL
jgi:carbonic anhydrase